MIHIHADPGSIQRLHDALADATEAAEWFAQEYRRKYLLRAQSKPETWLMWLARAEAPYSPTDHLMWAD